jgi:hypothetical protein
LADKAAKRPLSADSEQFGSGQSHFKIGEEFILKGHGFSRALSKPVLFKIPNPNAIALQFGRQLIASDCALCYY